MNADYVEKIIRNIDEEFYTYKCILVDGTWGIGKSYMVRKALEDKKDRTCFVSLFGMDNVQQIYHEILFQLLLRSADGGKMIRWLKDATKVFGNFSYGAKNINTVLESRFSELDALVALSQKFETKHVVVIDDLERYKESLKLREIFGVIENLKQCHDIYVIAVANLNELENKKEFDKYNEKVIDRIFQITEYSSQIKWSNLNVEPSFAVRFFQKHKTANLRTIQKAQRFFTDVSGYCDGIKDERFRDEIRQICFAVVIEDTDKLYYIDPQNRDNSSKENRIQNIMEEQENKIESRISNYTQHLKSSRDFITVIYGYYKNQIALTREEIIVQYKLYQSSGEKANYYKSDKELEYYLDSWKSGLENISNSPILTKTAGEYDYWFVFLDRNDTELICVYKEKIIELLIKEVQEQEYEPMRYYRLNEFHTQTDNIKAALDEGYDVAIYTVVKKYVRYLVNTMDDVTAEKYSRALVEWYRNSDKLKKIIASELQVLYKRSSFPADNMNDHKYAASYNVLEMLYKNNKVYFEQYYADLKKDFDKMSTKRTDNMLNEIKQNNSGD